MLDIDENGYCRECGINDEKLYAELALLKKQRDLLAARLAYFGCQPTRRDWSCYETVRDDWLQWSENKAREAENG